ncbi:MAG: 4Fe-4S dicluster domain-containing protein [Gemmatimonadetes bacterium]|nr:4Fe-4S dicluster domain-containing protein [Gemmatimonadota bacterium]
MSSGTAAGDLLAQAVADQEDRLANCVHCGFCLPACPTYRRLGDEADSPRGRLYLMKAVAEGRIEAGSDAFQVHIDRCLGCRACEPVCPSGVEYGALLETARDLAAQVRRPSPLSRALLWTMARRWRRRLLFLGGRVMRATGLASLGASVGGSTSNARFAMAMLSATAPWRPGVRSRSKQEPESDSNHQVAGLGGVEGWSHDVSSPRVGVLEGCVQKGLFDRINEATRRTLGVNGYEVVQVPRQDCCGALHAHGGDLAEARRLARLNILAFEEAGVDVIAVNAAGCGAAMKDYGTLLEGDPDYATRAAQVAGRVRDVTELLAHRGPRPGGPVPCRIAYDHPCHLLHAQGVVDEPLAVLAAVPGADVQVVERAEECCGGAGIYGMTHPELGGAIGRDKAEAVQACGADLACTPNPGCMMQIGAVLRLQGEAAPVAHPVEVLDISYERAGYYG